MTHLSARFHAFYHGLFRRSPRRIAHELYCEVADKLEAAGIASEGERLTFAHGLAGIIRVAFRNELPRPIDVRLETFMVGLFDFETMFVLPDFDWAARHSVTEYWTLQDELQKQKKLIDGWEDAQEKFVLAACQLIDPLVTAIPKHAGESTAGDGISVPTALAHLVADMGAVVVATCLSVFDDELVALGLFDRSRKQFEANLVAASGGNPADPKASSRTLRSAAQSDIKNPSTLAAVYLGNTPIAELFTGELAFVIPSEARFEHHHIAGGSGHGKTQTLQYLIAADLQAVANGRRTLIVIDSQGDLIRNISRLKIFAPGEALHDRIVIIDPNDVEWPVSLNLFDVGLERLDRYSRLDRERLTNSIIELYDYVLGTLLSAEMTQKQNVIFRYVTRLMLQIPGATIHTLRELMEPKSEIKFAAHIAKLTGTARSFFETEFGSSEFTQTRKQVLRRLWGILENQTFERMFAHPKSKLDLFSEMNAGKVILINTAKDLLKESGTEIFGRFFIALIVQAAQERATLPEKDRMPAIVYVDEAADYFDRNIGIILSTARKYKVGMVLAHQFLGQLDPKLLEAFASNTSIKFAGGVSNKDARTFAASMASTPEFIEEQPKGSFAAHIRGVTKAAIPLKFPFGHMEAMAQMTDAEWWVLRKLMRDNYAALIGAEFDGEQSETQDAGLGEPPPSPAAENHPKKTGAPPPADPDADDRAKLGW